LIVVMRRQAAELDDDRDVLPDGTFFERERAVEVTRGLDDDCPSRPHRSGCSHALGEQRTP